MSETGKAFRPRGGNLRRWFVHIDEPYYPSAWIVEAETPEGAVMVAWAEAGHRGPDDEDRVCFGVSPLDQVTFFGDHDQVRGLEQGRQRGYDEWEKPSKIVEAEIEPRPLPEGVYQPPTRAEIEKRQAWMAAHATHSFIPIASYGTLP